MSKDIRTVEPAVANIVYFNEFDFKPYYSEDKVLIVNKDYLFTQALEEMLIGRLRTSYDEFDLSLDYGKFRGDVSLIMIHCDDSNHREAFQTARDIRNLDDSSPKPFLYSPIVAVLNGKGTFDFGSSSFDAICKIPSLSDVNNNKEIYKGIVQSTFNEVKNHYS